MGKRPFKQWLSDLLESRTFAALSIGAVAFGTFWPFHGTRVALGAALLTVAAYYFPVPLIKLSLGEADEECEENEPRCNLRRSRPA